MKFCQNYLLQVDFIVSKEVHSWGFYIVSRWGLSCVGTFPPASCLTLGHSVVAKRVTLTDYLVWFGEGRNARTPCFFFPDSRMLPLFFALLIAQALANSVTAQVRNEFSEALQLKSAALLSGCAYPILHSLILQPGPPPLLKRFLLLTLTPPFGLLLVKISKEKLFTVIHTFTSLNFKLLLKVEPWLPSLS